MSWFLTIIVLSFTLNNLSEARHGKKLPSAVVVGTVYCDTCFQSDLSTTGHFISGALVAVECRGAGSKPSFREEVKTNEHGEFKFHLPFSVSKHVKRIKRCSVELINSSEPYCAVASTGTSSSLRLKSRKQGTHIFSAGFFTFKPLKQPTLCNQKPSVHTKSLAGPPVDDPSFPPPIQDPPMPLLPPIDHGHLPPLPELPNLPPLPALPPLPPLPGLGGIKFPPAVKNQLKSSKPPNANVAQQLLFQPLPPVPGIPLPPEPFDPQLVLPPNPFRPPPRVLPPNPVRPPPSVFPLNPVRPPPSVFPRNPVRPSPPLVNDPSVPGLTPFLPPPPPFSNPIPPFPFQPAPGFPGMPPASSSTKKISP